MPGGPSPVDQATVRRTDSRSYLEVAEGRRSLPPAELLVFRQRQELEDLARLHQQQRAQLEESERQNSQKAPVHLNADENLEHIRTTRSTLLAILQTVLRTLNGVAEKLPAGDAKSDILALTDMMGPLDTIAGEMTYSTHE